MKERKRDKQRKKERKRDGEKGTERERYGKIKKRYRKKSLKM